MLFTQGKLRILTDTILNSGQDSDKKVIPSGKWVEARAIVVKHHVWIKGRKSKKLKLKFQDSKWPNKIKWRGGYFIHYFTNTWQMFWPNTGSCAQRIYSVTEKIWQNLKMLIAQMMHSLTTHLLYIRHENVQQSQPMQLSPPQLIFSRTEELQWDLAKFWLLLLYLLQNQFSESPYSRNVSL